MIRSCDNILLPLTETPKGLAMKRVLVLLLLVLILSGCATTQPKGFDHSPGHPLESQVYSTMLTILRCSNYSQTDYRFCIWKSTEVNAFMCKNKVVVISTALLDSLIPESQETKGSILGCIIAHEISHDILGHGEKRETVNTATDIGVSGVLLAVEIVTGLPVSLAGYVVTPTITSAYSRSYELEADTNAVNLMRMANYPDPANIYTRTLEWFDAKKTNVQDWGLWNTHPSASERIKNVLSDAQ